MKTIGINNRVDEPHGTRQMPIRRFIALMLSVTLLGATPVSFAPAQAVAEEPDVLSISVLTYNVQSLILGNSWPATTVRAEAIGEEIAPYDLVVLQEVQAEGRRKDLINAANARRTELGLSAYHVILGPEANEAFANIDFPFQAHGGNAILSAWPIVETDTHIYKHNAGTDSWANKGVIYALLDLGDGRVLHTFATHLQAAGAEVQQKQFDELTQFILDQQIPADEPILIGGDMNTDGILPPPRYYSFQADMNLLGINEMWAGRTDGATNAGLTKRIDQWWVGLPAPMSVTNTSVVEFACESSQSPFPELQDCKEGRRSDHRGVQATITISATRQPYQYQPNLPFTATLDITRVKSLTTDSCNQSMDVFGRVHRFEGPLDPHPNQERNGRIFETNDGRPAISRTESFQADTESLSIETRFFDDDDIPCGGTDDDIDVSPHDPAGWLKIHVDTATGSITSARTGTELGRVGEHITLRGDRGDERMQVSFIVNMLFTVPDLVATAINEENVVAQSGTPLDLRFRLTNQSNSAAILDYLIVAIRNDDGQNLDVECQPHHRGLTVAPGTIIECETTFVPPAAGEFSAWVAWKREGTAWEATPGEERTISAYAAPELRASAVTRTDGRPVTESVSVGQVVELQYLLQNTHEVPARLDYWLLAARDPNQRNIDMPCQPSHRDAVLQPGSSGTCTVSFVADSAGEFKIWPGWLPFGSNWQATEGNEITITAEEAAESAPSQAPTTGFCTHDSDGALPAGTPVLSGPGPVDFALLAADETVGANRVRVTIFVTDRPHHGAGYQAEYFDQSTGRWMPTGRMSSAASDCTVNERDGTLHNFDLPEAFGPTGNLGVWTESLDGSVAPLRFRTVALDESDRIIGVYDQWVHLG